MITRWFYISMAVLTVFATVPRSAAADDLSYIKGKLVFMYVSDPNASGVTAEQIDTNKVLAGQGDSSFYKDANLDKFRQLIKALLGSGMSGVDHNTLRSVVAKTLEITGKPIGVYLINDNAADITNNTNINRFGITLESKRAWPCAICYTENRASQTWGGSFTLGAWHLNNTAQFSTLRSVLETFCHELMHTQDLSDGRTHIFGIHSYGQDQTHYFIEAIPNMAATYSEGIANFAGYWYNSQQVNKATKWFANNDYIIVEKNPPSFLYNSLQTAGISTVNPATTTFGNDIKTKYAIYRIQSLPAKVIVQNEQVIALILWYHAFYNGGSGTMAAIKAVNPNTYLVSTSAWAQLVDTLCRYGLPSGVTDCNSLTSPQTGEKRYLLPLAICDYFTAFRSTSAAEFRKLFEDMLPECWVNAYWPFRNAVRGVVNLNALKPEDITNMAIALGITSSQGP